MGIVPIPTPRRLFRYFELEAHAQRLVDGVVWLSTLEHVRKCDASRHDQSDATLTYGVTNLDETTPPEEAATIQARLLAMGAIGEPMPGMVMRYCEVAHRLPDAYVLCTSYKRLDKTLQRRFGKYCVEINCPGNLCDAVTDALEATTTLSQALFGPVIYKGRWFTDANALPGAVGFASEPSMADEKEARMLWLTEIQRRLEPMEIEVPLARQLCRRLN